MSIAFALLVIIVVLVVSFLVSTYNKLISLRNYVKEAFSTMDVYLKQRWDLVPNLIETVKGYMAHEKETLEKITELRNINYNVKSSNQKMDINNKLSLDLSNIIATAENYPDLKANENFNSLIQQLSSLESEIATARKYYNGTVREYNTAIQMFPNCVFAGIFNFTPEQLFEIKNSERQNVKVEF